MMNLSIRAKGAKGHITKCKNFSRSIQILCKDATLIFGTSARTRTIPWPTKNSSELSEILKKGLENINVLKFALFLEEK